MLVDAQPPSGMQGYFGTPSVAPAVQPPAPCPGAAPARSRCPWSPRSYPRQAPSPDRQHRWCAPRPIRVGAEDTSIDSGFLSDLLLRVLLEGCSDLHLTAGAAPTVRRNGSLVPLEGSRT